MDFGNHRGAIGLPGLSAIDVPESVKPFNYNRDLFRNKNVWEGLHPPTRSNNRSLEFR